MATEYIIYADESESNGRYFSHFYGGALVRSQHEEEVIAALNCAKEAQNLLGEIKWSKVSDQYLSKYMAVMDAFFALVHTRYIKVRIMFSQNAYVAQGLTDYHRENEYFLLYHEFIKHAFGLRHCNPQGLQRIRLRILFDKIPDSAERSHAFKLRILNLNNDERFRSNRITIGYDAVGQVDSKNHPVLQCLDVVLGAMQFRLNDKHKEKPAGAKRRAKKTVAKEKLYRYIRAKICEGYPNFNVGVSTSDQGDPYNRWLHPYAHWCFTPKSAIIDASKGKHYNPTR